MTKVETYWAKIFLGCKNTETGVQHSLDVASRACSEYVNSADLCVTFTPTHYIYNGARKEHFDVLHQESPFCCEGGVIIGMINYPRFPMKPEEIREKALELALILKVKLEQRRVTVMFPDETVMLGDDK